MIIDLFLWKRICQIPYRLPSLYETFRLRPERKISFSQKNLGPHFLSLNSVQTSVGVLFGYRKNLERIRRMRNVTFYDFRQVDLEPVKNAILSPVKTFD